MTRNPAIVFMLVVLAAGFSLLAASQTSAELQNYFRDFIALTQQQIAGISNGAAVAKVLNLRFQLVGKPESAGITRHVVEDERALQERSSESILASSLTGEIARCRLKRRQGYRWAGLLSFERYAWKLRSRKPMTVGTNVRARAIGAKVEELARSYSTFGSLLDCIP